MIYPSIPKATSKHSFAEYMRLEETGTELHDFYHGELFSVAGGSKSHNNIILKLGFFLKSNKKKGFDVFIDGMKLEIEKNEFYVYPDLLYTCGDDLKGVGLFVKNPSIIFEVLSDATASYDILLKLKYDKRIESLHYYPLIAQNEIMVEMYSRIEDSQNWQYQTFESMEEVIHFDRLDFELTVATIYDGIAFEAEAGQNFIA